MTPEPQLFLLLLLFTTSHDDRGNGHRENISVVSMCRRLPMDLLPYGVSGCRPVGMASYCWWEGPHWVAAQMAHERQARVATMHSVKRAAMPPGL